MARRNSIPQELVEQLFKLTGCNWQGGAVVTLLLLCASYGLYSWVDSIVPDGEGRPIIAALEKLSWILYSLPATMLFIAVIFALKTYTIYRKQSGI
ncbi:hypothetical protein G3495_14060 [Shewanella baltica]|uniref:hypothetical protein n=1 Tax=Shewanella baltica TaxID=62322 RepID=UPI00217D0A2A|nr:hypothetical protein [Shewanella baltica]MCS6236241.1 hypothetical protein [Shewanella baltica]MCS6270646.1 hypothetical protein [Shewanella baltica]